MKSHEKSNTKQKDNKITTEPLKSKVSSSRLGKTGRVNSFLQDPVAFATQEHELNLEPDQEPYVEPWLQDYEANQPALKEERAIRSEINAMLGITSDLPGKRELSLDIEKVDTQLISKKMKKYQPANGSFSLFYGEKKQFQKSAPEDLSSRGTSRSTKIQHFKLPVLPIKRSPQELKAMRLSHKSNKASSSFNSLSEHCKNKHLDIILQLKEIERTGEALTDYSARLIDRIDRASILADQKFGRLSHITYEMTADVGTYHLDEEINGSYKKQLFSTPSKYLKK